MSKIVSINGAPLASVLRITPAPIVHHLRALWVCGAVTQDTYFLGVAALGVMQANEAPTIALSRTQAETVYTELHGNVFTGPVAQNRLAFVTALQQLHLWGMLNHFDLSLLDESDAAERHFTLSPQLSSDDRWDKETLIYFRLPTATADEYAARVAEVFQARMSAMQTVVAINL